MALSENRSVISNGVLGAFIFELSGCFVLLVFDLEALAVAVPSGLECVLCKLTAKTYVLIVPSSSLTSAS